MHIQHLSPIAAPAQAFLLRQDKQPRHHNIWHYHMELEFIHIKSGEGHFFIGDTMQQFQAGDMVLIGSEVPHYWQFDEAYISMEETAQADIQVVHFHPEFCGKEFLNLWECQFLKPLYHNARQGILIRGGDDYLRTMFAQLVQHSGLRRLTTLLEGLEYVALHSSFSLLAHQGQAINHHAEDFSRLNKVMQYIQEELKQKISLPHVAAIADMTINSFCRYFKLKTGKSCMQYIQELRIAYACKLLLIDGATVKQVCLDSGFQNYVSFHKTFKQCTGTTPALYKKSHRA